MDIYLFSVILGAVGLSAMAIAGLGRHGHGGTSHGGHGHAGHGGAHVGGHGGHSHSVSAGHHGHGDIGGASRIAGVALMSPRFILAGLLGFGLVGIALQTILGGITLLLVAIVGAVAVERLLFNPIWKFAMRFASNPANTLESATFGEAKVVSNFDRNGQGIVAVEVDGQIQQILATLSETDRAKGASVRAGQLVRVEEVDGARHRCTVSVL
jgi:hypothetical protein